jgi:hypothetical protein
MTVAITDRRFLRISRLRRLVIRTGWMLLIWMLSVGGLGVAAWSMRLLMRAIGMAS